MLSPVYFELCNDVISPSVAMVEFVSLVRAYLENHGLIKRNKPHTDKDNHKECSIVKLTERLAKVKNACRKYFSSNPREFLCFVRAHNKVKQVKDQCLNNRSARKQERAFKQNPWKFSKSVCEMKQNLSLIFFMSACLKHFQSIYFENEVTYILGLPDWVSQVMLAREIEEEFDLSTITPRLIKGTLQK